jgi:hypothetical protein
VIKDYTIRNFAAIEKQLVYLFVSLLQVTFKLGLGTAIITDDQIRGTLRVSWKSSRERWSCVLRCMDLEHGQFYCIAHVFCSLIIFTFLGGRGLNTTILACGKNARTEDHCI